MPNRHEQDFGMRVSAIMRSHVVTLPADATVRMAVDIFDLHQQPVVPVVDASGGLVGALWLRDLAETLLTQDQTSTEPLLGADVQDAMDPSPVAVCENDLVREAARFLLRSGRDAVIVLDDSRVVGLVGLPELCRAACEQAK